jgi:hypothetical protein
MGYLAVVGKNGRISGVRCFEQEPPQVVKQRAILRLSPIVAEMVVVASARVESLSPERIKSTLESRRHHRYDSDRG